MVSSKPINYSEFSALAMCEWRWMFGYLLNEQEEGARRGLHLGTLLHLGADRWMRGLGATLPSTWTDDINTGGKPGEERTLSLTDFESELVARAIWLLGRYAECYGEQPPSSWNVISTEEWLTATLPDGTVVVGRTDGLFEDHLGRLWLREVKSYGSKGRLDTIGVEPQPTIYYKLVEAKYGRKPFGIMYDGIYTYQWKPERRTLAEIEEEIKPRHEGTKADLRAAAKVIQANEPGKERPAHESFQREWIDRNQDQLDINDAILTAAVRRRDQLIPRYMPENPEWALFEAMPNVGHSCNSCGFKRRCWDILTGDNDIEIEAEDDESLEPV